MHKRLRGFHRHRANREVEGAALTMIGGKR